MTTPTFAPGDAVTTRYDSDWSASVSITTEPDEAPPPAPSAPQAARITTTSGRFLWDGLGAFGEAMPADLEAAELHLSTSAGFTATLPADRVPGYDLATDTYRADVVPGRPLDITGLTAGATYFAALVARDKAQNHGPMSPITSL